VAGLRKPSDSHDSHVEPESSAERTGQIPVVPPAETRKPRPRPAPRPQPAPRFEAGTGSSAEDTAVFAPVSVEEEQVDALTGEPEAAAPVKAAPRRKKRDSGRAKPVDVEEAEAEVAPTPAAGGSKSSASPLTLAIVLAVVGLVLFGAATFFGIQRNGITSATSNTALLDVAKTAQVKDAVSKATEALFSYDYNNIKKTEDAANDLLANDDVKAKYNLLMGEVKRLAPAQKMVVTCKVTRSAVIMLNDDLAKVMVFVDQTSTRADTKKTTAGSAQLHLNAQLQGDKWKITDMDTYVAPQAPQPSAGPGAPPPPPPPPPPETPPRNLSPSCGLSATKTPQLGT
jgi:Mce-associated membrane protein